MLPFIHSSGGGPVATGDPELISRRRESIASVFPSSTAGTGFHANQRRNSSFTCEANADADFYNSRSSPPEEVIVGSFIKTSMTSELYSEGEVIVEEEQLDIENYDKQLPQNMESLQHNQKRSNSTSSTSSFLGGIDFWTKKPTETIINLFSSNSNTSTSDYIRGKGNGDGRFSFSSHHSRGSVTTINEEEEDEQPRQQHNTVCGFLRNMIMQIINSIFRS